MISRYHIRSEFRKELLKEQKRQKELGYPTNNSLCMHAFLNGGCKDETCNRLHLADAITESYNCGRKEFFSALSVLKTKNASKKLKPSKAVNANKNKDEVCKNKVKECICAFHIKNNMKGLIDEIQDLEKAAEKMPSGLVKQFNELLCKKEIEEIYRTAGSLKKMISSVKRNIIVGTTIKNS